MIPILVHETQFPANVRAELLSSLRRAQLNHKFLYDSPSQTRKWLALHQACSPSRTEPGCETAYDQAFLAVAAMAGRSPVNLVGLGCGGGKKDARLLCLLSQAGASTTYTPVDVSVAMVLEACETVMKSSSPRLSPGIVCDLAQVRSFAELLEAAHTQTVFAPEAQQTGTRPATAITLTTFFGMIPNFEPGAILPALSSLLKDRSDLLLFSANMAPGPDYRQGVNKILPLYNNALTRDWLMGFLTEIGIAHSDGTLDFIIETDPENDLLRIAAHFTFRRPVTVRIDADHASFEAGSRLRVFFSYRHTCASIMRLLRAHGMRVVNVWLAPSDEEGVFLVQRED